jgi:hypothetical protein
MTVPQIEAAFTIYRPGMIVSFPLNMLPIESRYMLGVLRRDFVLRDSVALRAMREHVLHSYVQLSEVAPVSDVAHERDIHNVLYVLWWAPRRDRFFGLRTVTCSGA